MSHDRIDFQRHVYLLVNALSTSFQKSGAVCVWVIFRSICGSYWKCHRYTSHYPRARMMMDESHAIKDNMAPFMFLIGSYKDFSLYICLDYPGRPLKAEIFSTCPINLIQVNRRVIKVWNELNFELGQGFKKGVKEQTLRIISLLLRFEANFLDDFGGSSHLFKYKFQFIVWIFKLNNSNCYIPWNQ